MATNKLTEIAVKKATFGKGPKTRADGAGLFLQLAESGSKYWRYSYRFGGKEKLFAIGVWPAVTLANARVRHQEARKLLDQGIDPSAAKKVLKAGAGAVTADSFEAVARECAEIKRDNWSPLYATRWIERLEKDVFPFIGSRPLSAITPPELLTMLRRIESRGVRETAHTCKQICGQVFRYGVATSRCERDPTADLTEGLRPVMTKNMAAITDPVEFGDLLRAMDGYQGSPVTRCAMLLSALTFQRPANVRAMKWADLDLDAALWSIPSEDMKRTRHGKANGRPHLVPLSSQAVGALRELQHLTGHGGYVFPSLHGSGRCMSENTVNTALRRLGIDQDAHCAHGFRSSARTMLVERLDVMPDIVEAQLAHAKSGPLGSAYDRAEFMAQRRTMMQKWADYLDELRKGADVVPLRRTA